MTDIVLTQREMQVLVGISFGQSNGMIGTELELTEDTVKTHARKLFAKLGARDRANAVRIGFELGLLTAYTPTQRENVTVEPPKLEDWLKEATPRRPESDRHIAACFAAEACWCRHESRKSA